MKQINFQKLLPHLVAVLIFLVLSVIFTKPALEGKVVQQHDVQQVKAMAQQSEEFKAKYGYYPRWTNSMFCGTPAYQIVIGAKSGSFVSVGYFQTLFSLGLPKPVYYLFFACLGMYFLCIVLRINPWVSIAGAIAYGYCSYNPILIAAGHDTKLLSMAYAPAVLGAMFLIFQKKYWLGSALLLIFATCMLGQSHQQIVYYTMITAFFAVIWLLIKAIKQKEYKHIPISLGINAVMPVIALLVCSLGYFSTYEYAPESMRGGASELSRPEKKATQTKGGLDKEYAFNWSYGKAETMSLLAANATGGGSTTPMPEDSKVLELLQGNTSIPQEMGQQLYQAASAYWGARPSTSGPVYLGAIICFLFLAGLFLGKNEHRWWLLATAVTGILLAWGKNLEGLNYFLFDHLPFYNKFRTPEMALVMTQFAIPLSGALFLNELVAKTDKDELLAIGKKSLIIAGSIIVLLAGFYFMADYKNDATQELRKNLTTAMQNGNPEFIKDYMGAIVKDRQALYATDMWRSIGFLLVAALAIFLYCRKVINSTILYALLIFTITVDLMSVDKRYLTYENFVEPEDYQLAYADYNADIQIKRDPGFFRILNLAFQGGDGNFQTSIGNTFNDAIACYKHNNIGGYHPAKLALFEDIKEQQLYKNIQAWGANPQAPDSFQVLNMLNMKYVIVPDQQNPKQTMAIPNPYALGNCWLVKNIRYVKNADEEMKALDDLKPLETVVIDERFRKAIPFEPVYDSAAYIKLQYNKNDEIKYDFNAATNQFAVFSEIYYKKGWLSYIDGKQTDYCRVNYALRGLAIPAGKHTVEFKFVSKLIDTGEMVSRYASIFSVLFVLLAAFMIWKNSRKETA